MLRWLGVALLLLALSSAKIHAMGSKSDPLPFYWRKVAPGVWRGQIGRADEPTPLSAAGARQAPGPPDAELPFKGASGKMTHDFAVARIPLAFDEKLYGLGLQMEGMNRRGQVFHLRVDHYAEGHDRLHAPVPLYVSSHGYAVLFDTSRPINIYTGIGNRRYGPNPTARDRNTDPKWDAEPPSDAVEASVEGPGLTVYVFAGPTPMQAVQRYNMFCGGGVLPPRWALGFWHRVPLTATQAEAENEVNEFRKRGFPLDVLGLEPGWQSRSYPCTFEWSPERFPEPKKMLDDLKAKGVHVNLWTNPYVAEQSPVYEQLEPTYASHMVWLGAVADLSLPLARKTIGDYFKKEHLDLGVSGYKVDEIDGFDNWLWPDHAEFPSGISGLRMRQLYGLYWQRTLTDLFHSTGTRTFGLARGSDAGASSLPFALYSDTYNHAQYINGMISTGFSGVLWCAEARDAANGEEWVRRMQTATVSHIAQLNAWASGTHPWSFPGYEDAVRAAMEFRTRLTPYLYTAFAEYHWEGTPVIRPMALVDGGEEADQFMLGDDLLVAPMLIGHKSRKVWLPKGTWYDFDSGEQFTGGTILEITPALEKIPIFVRQGALIPFLRGAPLNTSETAETVLDFRAYGQGPYHGRLYDDDGETFGYEKGDFGWFAVSAGDGKPILSLMRGKRSAVPRLGEVIHVTH